LLHEWEGEEEGKEKKGRSMEEEGIRRRNAEHALKHV